MKRPAARLRGFLLGALVALASSAAAGTALADPSVADKETARRLMAEGREKRDAKDLKAALTAFTGADAIMHVPTTGLEVARTQVALGQLLEAHETALRVARLEVERDEPPPFAKARDAARDLSDELDRRIPTVTVKLDGAPPGSPPKVTVDGALVPNASLSLPRALNPGHHVIVAQASGKQGRAEVDLTEGQHRDVPITVIGAETPDPGAGGGGADEPNPSSGGGHLGKPILITGAVVGGVGLLVGAIAGFSSLSKTSSVKDACTGNACPSTKSDDIDSAKTMATISDVGFVVAGVGAATAVIGFFIMRGEKPKPIEETPAAFQITPWITPQSAGVLGRF